MRLPAWTRVRRTRTVAGTVEVTLAVDTTAFEAAMADSASVLRYHQAIAHQRSLGQAYVGVQLDELARSCGLDPVQAWRLPRARDLRLAGLGHSDRAVRQAAEAEWLSWARAHQAEQAAARQAAARAAVVE